MLEDYKGAIIDYTKALEIYPSHLKALYNRGIARKVLGDMLGACEDFSKVAAMGEARAQMQMEGLCR